MCTSSNSHLVCCLETALQQLDHAALCRRAYMKLTTEMEAQALIKNFSGFIFNGKPLDLFFRGNAAFVVQLFFPFRPNKMAGAHALPRAVDYPMLTILLLFESMFSFHAHWLIINGLIASFAPLPPPLCTPHQLHSPSCFSNCSCWILSGYKRLS